MAAEPLVQTAWPTNREEDAPMPARRLTMTTFQSTQGGDAGRV
jgi:hypothetical protein